MDISRRDRNTSLLALSLTIDSALRGDDSLRDSKPENIQKHRVRGQASRNILRLSPRLRRKRIPA